MRLFTDGAEMGDVLFFDYAGGASAVSTPTPLVGAYCYQIIGGYDVSGMKVLGNLTEFYFRVRYRWSGGSVGRITFSNSIYPMLVLDADFFRSRLNITNGSVTGSTSGGSLRVNQWYLIEVYFKLDAVAGAIQVKIDGVSEYSYAGNTRQSYPASVQDVYGYAAGSVMYWDDLALNDTSGGSDNSWCGDGYVECLIPDGNGDRSDLLGSDGNKVDNYLQVDEVPSDGDTTYNESSTAGEYDLYALGAFDGTNKTIRRMFVDARARSTGAVGDQCKLIVKTGGSIYKSSAINLGSNYNRQVGTDYLVNPNTGIAWTDADLDALQVGMEVV